MALRISDMTTETTINDSSKLPFVKEDGLGDYLNRNITASDLKTYMQTGISGLPPGTAGKVMYYSTVWGKSANFETDGTNVAIGQTIAFKPSRLTIYDGGGSKDYTLFLQNGNTKLVTHKHGTTFIGNYDTNKETSGFGTAIKLYNQGNFYNESDVIINNSSLLKFSSIDNNGNLTTYGTFGSSSDGMYLLSKNSTSGMYMYETYIGHVDTGLLNNGNGLIGVKNKTLSGRYNSYIGVNTQDIDADTSAGTIIGRTDDVLPSTISIRLQNKAEYTALTTDVFMDFMGDGKIKIYNLPTSSAGLASGTLWSDSGTLKIA